MKPGSRNASASGAASGLRATAASADVALRCASGDAPCEPAHRRPHARHAPAAAQPPPPRAPLHAELRLAASASAQTAT